MPLHIENHSRQLTRFLFSQYFSDGVRISFCILLPAVIAYHYDLTHLGITFSLGAMCVSIADNPGPANHRRNAMLVTLGLVVLTAVFTGLLNRSIVGSSALIMACCFAFSMLNVFGARAGSVGLAALIVMVLGIDQRLTATEVFQYAGLLLAGGTWYFIIALFTQTFRPYRPAEQTLGECMIEVADFIRLKAAFYDTSANTDALYKQLLDEQVKVHQHQENVRDILFRTRRILRDSSPAGRRLLLTFVDLVDLYEEAMATHYDYKELHRQYDNEHGILTHLHDAIIAMATELAHIGTGLHNHTSRKPLKDLITMLNALKTRVDRMEAAGIPVHVLKRILVNLRNIAVRVMRMYDYQSGDADVSPERRKEFRRFVEYQAIDIDLFRANLSTSSSHFRHAVRMSLICLAAFVFTRLVSEGQHSYWILLTVLVILKPGYTLTRERNTQRLIGTIAGGVIGLAVLTFFPQSSVRFGFLLLFMLLSYSFVRLRYVVSVLFMTPYILIVFSFTGNTNDVTVTWERIIDTIIGAVAAYAGILFVFPSWESGQVPATAEAIVRANAHYLRSVLSRDASPESAAAYRLARKQLYMQTANLTSVFQRMLSEPKRMRSDTDTLYRFMILNNQLSAYLATLSRQCSGNESFTDEQLRPLRSALFVLEETLEKLGGKRSSDDVIANRTQKPASLPAELPGLIYQTATDIRKVVQRFSFASAASLTRNQQAALV